MQIPSEVWPILAAIVAGLFGAWGNARVQRAERDKQRGADTAMAAEKWRELSEAASKREAAAMARTDAVIADTEARLAKWQAQKDADMARLEATVDGLRDEVSESRAITDGLRNERNLLNCQLADERRARRRLGKRIEQLEETLRREGVRIPDWPDRAEWGGTDYMEGQDDREA